MRVRGLSEELPLKVKEGLIPPMGFKFIIDKGFAYEVTFRNPSQMRFTATCVGVVEKEPEEEGVIQEPNATPDQPKPESVTLRRSKGRVSVGY